MEVRYGEWRSAALELSGAFDVVRASWCVFLNFFFLSSNTRMLLSLAFWVV